MSKKTTPIALFLVMIQIIAIWIISDIGYYQLLSLLGIGSNYSTKPLVIALYYLFWIGVTLYIFWNLYKSWKMINVRASMFLRTMLASIAAACYLFYILPLFPAVHWVSLWQPPSDLLSASPWYFLPKSIEIVLQQLLVIAMILAFDARKLTLRTISYWSAALFGGIHLLMVFGGSSAAYVSIFTMSAVVAGLIFPYLILRIENGFVHSYFLHWGFYALVIVLVRTLHVL